MKILIIGQAPPAVQQEYPYSTTMLYEWFREVGVSKEQALEIFDFDAVSDKFPGHGISGHKPPSIEDMNEYYQRSLKEKIESADKIILLGSVSANYLIDKSELQNKKVLKLIHPSSRNRHLYNTNKKTILEKLALFLQN